MKKIIFFFSFLFSIALTAQETTTAINRTSDSTFIQINTTTYSDGRIVTEQIPYSLDEFANMIVENNINALIGIDQRTKQNVSVQRDVNTLERFISDTLSINYDSIMAKKLLVALEGDWTLVKRISGVDTELSVSIRAHPTLPHVLRLRDNTNAANYNIASTHTQKFTINNFSTGQGTESITLSLTQFPNFTGYNGFSADKSVRLILKR